MSQDRLREVALRAGLAECFESSIPQQTLWEDGLLNAILRDPCRQELWKLCHEAGCGFLYETLRRGCESGEPPPGWRYTPERIGRELTGRAIGAWYGGRSGDEIPTILDLGCGCGAFLIWAVEALAPLVLRARARDVARSLFGVDLDEHSVWIARQAVGAAFQRVFERSVPKGCFEEQIRTGDALFDSMPLLKRQYDLVIGNPPWVSLKGRFRKDCYPVRKVQELVRRFSLNTYRPNLAEAFFRAAMDRVRPDGIIALVLPDRFAENLQFESLRRRVLRDFELLEVDFNASIPGAVSDNMTLLLCRRLPPATHSVCVRLDPTTPERRVLQSELLCSPQASFRPRSSGSPEKTVPLGQLVRTGVGFIARAGAIREVSGPGMVGIVRGRDIVRYGRVGKVYIHWEKRNRIGGTQRLDKLTAVPRILLRKTGDTFTATLDETSDLPEQSLYFLYAPDPRLSLKVLLAWINSAVLRQITGESLFTNRRTIVQIKKRDLECVPVPESFLCGRDLEAWQTEVERLVTRRMDSHAVTAKEIESRLERLLVSRATL